MDDAEKLIGAWLLGQARLSFRYWHSSKSARKYISMPMFDRNQTDIILDEFRKLDVEKGLA